MTSPTTSSKLSKNSQIESYPFRLFTKVVQGGRHVLIVAKCEKTQKNTKKGLCIALFWHFLRFLLFGRGTYTQRKNATIALCSPPSPPARAPHRAAIFFFKKALLYHMRMNAYLALTPSLRDCVLQDKLTTYRKHIDDC